VLALECTFALPPFLLGFSFSSLEETEASTLLLLFAFPLVLLSSSDVCSLDEFLSLCVEYSSYELEFSSEFCLDFPLAVPLVFRLAFPFALPFVFLAFPLVFRFLLRFSSSEVSVNSSLDSFFLPLLVPRFSLDGSLDDSSPLDRSLDLDDSSVDSFLSELSPSLDDFSDSFFTLLPFESLPFESFPFESFPFSFVSAPFVSPAASFLPFVFALSSEFSEFWSRCLTFPFSSPVSVALVSGLSSSS